MNDKPFGYLYAIIYDQGTVKAGMTTRPETRFVSLQCDANKWGIKVSKRVLMPVFTNDLAYRELVMCGHLEMMAPCVSGYEWFKFKSVEIAYEKITSVFDMVKNNDFSQIQRRSFPEGRREKIKLDAAMDMIANGATARDAAKKLKMSIQSIINTKVYKNWAEKSYEINETHKDVQYFGDNSKGAIDAK